jgi:hypothetical protein
LPEIHRQARYVLQDATSLANSSPMK